MKKNLLFVILLFAFSTIIATNVVPPKDAKQAAKNFIIEMAQKSDFNASQLTLSKTISDESGSALMYIYNIEDYGFVIVSAYEEISPILAFSFESSFKNNPQVDNYVANYKEVIKAVKKTQLKTESAKEEWSHYLTSDFAPNRTKNAAGYVEPLITTLWDQGRYFNAHCPIDQASSLANYDGRCLVGCVALTMANLMNYYRYPSHGLVGAGYYHQVYGVLTANFANFDYNYKYITDEVDSYEDALATIAYHSGIAVQMNYGPDGSGASSSVVSQRMNTHFGFFPGDFENASDANAIAELKNYRPLFFSASSTIPGQSGHAWICDGYINNGTQNFFHMNWGWSGQSNGYFRINATPVGFPQNLGASQQIYRFLSPDSLEIKKTVIPDTSYYYATHGSVCDGAGNAGYKTGITRTFMIKTPNATSYTLIPRKIKLLADDILVVYAYRNGNIVNPPVATWQGEYKMALTSEHNGGTSTIPGLYPGTAIPSAINVIADSIRIMFIAQNVADTNISLSSYLGRQYNGFNINYKAAFNAANAQYCNLAVESITNTQGTITDKGLTPTTSLENFYKPDTRCSWRINTASLGCNGMLFDFSKFHLMAGDRVMISSNQNLKYCFDNENIPYGYYYVQGPLIDISFRADNYLEWDGFELNYVQSTIVPNNTGLENLLVYPNPASNNITVTFTTVAPEYLTIKMVDLAGKLVYSQTLNHVGGDFNYSIPVSNLASGMYLLNIATDNGKATHKIIVE